MDVFERVQKTRPEIDGADENLASSRAVLLREIEGEQKKARSFLFRRPRVVVAGIVGVGVAAAVTVGVLAITSVVVPAPANEAVPTREAQPSLVPSPMPSAPPTPAGAPQVLVGAANAAAAFSPPVLEPGQYLRRSWTEERLWIHEPGLTEAGVPTGLGGSRATATSGWLLRRTGADFAPADLRAQWYAESGPAELRAVFGDEAEAQVEGESMRQRYGAGQTLAPNVPWLPESGAENYLWYFDMMPRDPQEMIAWIRDYLGSDAEGWEEGKVGWMLIGLLSFNAGDPQMRASMYRALSLLPGSAVSDEHDGRRTVTFDSHLALPDRPLPFLQRYTMSIEMATGLVTEITNTTDPTPGVIPMDVPDLRVTYSMSVVDALP